MKQKNSIKSRILRKKLAQLCVVMLLLGTISALFAHAPIDRNALNYAYNIAPVAVIGGGAAGMGAALYTARARIPTLVIEENRSIDGGESLVENWLGTTSITRKELFDRFRKHAQSYGVEIEWDEVKRIDFSRWPYIVETKSGKKIAVLSVIIATGSTSQDLNIPGQRTYWGKGVAECSACDAPKCAGKVVVVCGHSKNMLDEIMQIASYAKKVIVVRSDVDSKLIRPERLHRATNVFFDGDRKIEKIVGDGNKVTGVQLCTIDSQEREAIEVDMVFLVQKRQGRSKIFGNSFALDDDACIKTDTHSQKTAIPGVFAAGAVENLRYNQIGVSAGDGAKAGMDAISFLGKMGLDSFEIKKLEKRLFPALQKRLNHGIQYVGSGKELDALLHNDVWTVVKFYSPKCHYCRQMEPSFEKVANQYRGSIRFIKANIEKNAAIMRQFKVRGVPTMVLFFGKKRVAAQEGIMQSDQMQSFIEDNISLFYKESS